jgi:Tannase and feruloyl esterase
MRIRVLHISVIAGICISLLSVMRADADPCTDLAKLAYPGLSIESAELISAGSIDRIPGFPPFPANWTLPGYCKAHGSIHKRIGADGAQYAIQFEIRLPTNWNRKLLFQGGGGLDGVVQPALGFVNPGAMPALSRGYATVSTDSGHEGVSNTSFGREQQSRLDYAYSAIGEVARIAKVILTHYYGTSAQHSYFVGCSNGGREGMIAVQRYPLEFDGVVAGDPGFELSHAAIGEAWDNETFNAIAPKDSKGNRVLSRAFSPSDLTLVSKAVLRKCDRLDGIEDGEINNFAACKFDPEELVCQGSKVPSCLTREQVDALKRSFNGAHSSSGAELYASWLYDAGVSDMGWRIWKLGTSETGESNAINETLGAHALKDYFVHPFLPTFDPLHVDFDKISDEVEQTQVINDPTGTDLGTFASRGGRLIIFQGVSDPVFSANDIVRYYQRFVDENGGNEKAGSIARLFLIPGMNHCGGGPATDQFDPLTALEQWVESGKAPDRILATGKTFPNRTRPLCPYPQYASYKGSGEPEDASNFVCE